MLAVLLLRHVLPSALPHLSKTLAVSRVKHQHPNKLFTTHRITGLAPPNFPTGLAPPSALERRQEGTATSPAKSPRPTLTPEQKAALGAAAAKGKAVNECLCKGNAFKAALDCVPAACASATGLTVDPAVGLARVFNGVCKGVAGWTPLVAPAKAAGGA